MKLNKIKKWLISTALSVSMTVGLATPALAADLRDTAVTADAEDIEESDTEEDIEVTNSDGETETSEDNATEDSVNAKSEETTKAAREAVKTEAAKGNYLKEIRLSVADNDEDAKSWLAQNDYEIIDQNLSDSDKSVYMGYTTTENVSEAVRDVALMNMTGNYIITDYETIMQEQYDAYAGMESDFATMIKAYRENYEAKSTYAIAAHDYLNSFYEEDSKRLLGDYLLTVDLTPSTKTHVSKLAGLITEMSQSALYIMFNYLSIGLVNAKDDGSFLKKLSDMTAEEIAAAKTNRANGDKANQLSSVMSSFADELYEMEQALEGEQDSLKELQRESTVDLIGILDEIPYDDGSLRDFFMKDELSSEDLAPLAQVLTDAQVCAMKYGAISTLITTDADYFDTLSAKDEKEISDAQKKMSEIVKEQSKQLITEYGLETNDDHAINIYFGIDRSEMKGIIAVTTDALNQMKATGDFSILQGGIGVAIGTIAGILMVASCFVMVNIVLKIPSSGLDFTRLGSFIGQEGAVNTTNFTNTVQKSLSTATKIKYGVGFVVALLASLIFGAICVFVFDQIAQASVVKVPDVIIDKRADADGRPYMVRYNAIYDNNLKPGDLNGYETDEWNVLYESTSIDAGDPITDKVRITKGELKSEAGEFTLHKFGTDDAFNLQNEESPMYVYFARQSNSDFSGTIFGGVSGVVALLIIGMLLGAALLAFIQMLQRRRRKAA